MKSAYPSDLKEIGPHTAWPQEFEAGYLRSIFTKTTVTSASMFVVCDWRLVSLSVGDCYIDVQAAYDNGANAINILFRMKLNPIEINYWAAGVCFVQTITLHLDHVHLTSSRRR